MRFRVARQLRIPVWGGLVLLVGLAVAAGLFGLAVVPGGGRCPAGRFAPDRPPDATDPRCPRQGDRARRSPTALAPARPTAPTPPPTPHPRLAARPVAVIPPAIIPHDATLIRPDADGLQGVTGLPDPIDNVWDGGAIPNPTGAGYGVIRVYAVAPHALLSVPNTPGPQIRRLFLRADAAMPDLGPRYDATWVCPRPIGSLTITHISGPTGVVWFTATDGESGTLDLATGAWTFSDLPYRATLIRADPQGLNSINGLPSNKTSIWDDGAILDPSHQGYGSISVYAVGPHDPSGMGPDIPQPQIARLFWPVGNVGGLDPTLYDSRWVCPRAIGSLGITNITGPDGVVSFTSSSGVSGTLDMATGAWGFGP
jgi:hypothetical protein